MKYETVIGLEVHIELSTATKIFCGCSTDFGAAPNTHTCPVCLGFPGALPVLNRQVVMYAIRIAVALGCKVTPKCRFDRKHYFYPDNPQNYQISQLYAPIGTKGAVELYKETAESQDGDADGATGAGQIVRIHELHMEEDAGKLIHDEAGTTIDFNRAGVPLIEIVTEPDMHESDEVIRFLTWLRTTIRYLGVSDCKMNEGSLRVDVNLSVRKPGAPLGVRTEMKNLNSFKAVARAIESERNRQIAILEQGGQVEQETRGWDDERNVSYLMRSKEDAKDYRYFPDPDLPPVYIPKAWVDEIRSKLPEPIEQKRKRYRDEYGLTEYDAAILTSDKPLADIFEKTVRLPGAEPKQVKNWLLGETMRILKERGLETDSLTVDPASLRDLIVLTGEGAINSTTAKKVFEVMFDEPVDVRAYVEKHGLLMMRDGDELKALVERIVRENPKSAADFKAGKKKAIGHLIGQTMKETKGQADPELVRELFTIVLGEDEIHGA